MNADVLHFLVKGVDNIQSNPKKLKKLNERINEKTQHDTLHEMLDYGLCLFPFSFSLCLISTRIFSC